MISAESFDRHDWEALCGQLRDLAPTLDAATAWPARQLELCAQHGVFSVFSTRQWGGLEWSDEDICRVWLELSAACLTTAFVLTQRQGACRRIENSQNEPLKRRLIPELNEGSLFATVGISHLTTSRRHLKTPAMQAAITVDGFELNGYSPWVTGGCMADVVVAGATLPDGREILVAVDTGWPGVTAEPGVELVALSASQTGAVKCDGVSACRDFLIAGPVENVMQTGSGAATGGLQTSALAIGLSRAAIKFTQQQSEKRADLKQPAELLHQQQQELEQHLLALAGGRDAISQDELRSRANSLALRSTQSALSAAKGAGYVAGHPAGRWCREALFFLVWSCPQTVMNSNLCQFAGIADE